MARYLGDIQTVGYQPQFDPAEVEMVQGIINARNQAYQKSQAAYQQEKLRQGEMFFLDENARQQAMQDFENRSRSIVDKYEGDYEAAAPELAQEIIKERSNPLYNLNKFQIAQREKFEKDLRRIGPENAIITKPVSSSLYDEQGNLKDPSAFEYNIVNMDDYQRNTIQWVDNQIQEKQKPKSS